MPAFGAHGSARAGQADQVSGVSGAEIALKNAILDQIKADVAWATIAQDTWSMGYWSLMSMYTWKHSLLSPMTAWKSGGFAPLPQYIQTGVALVTKENTQEFLMRPKKAADSWGK